MKPRFVVVDPNTLAAVGMKQLLQEVMPMAEVDTYGSFAELEANHPETVVHFFVATNIFLESRPFFQEHRRRTIVLTASASLEKQLSGFNTLCANQPERQLMAALRTLQHRGHPHADIVDAEGHASCLTEREAEVLVLVVQGYINKQIAEKLGIALTTVITHRKNIMKKLRLKSVPALTIYAVMQGYVDVDTI